MGTCSSNVFLALSTLVALPCLAFFFHVIFTIMTKHGVSSTCTSIQHQLHVSLWLHHHSLFCILNCLEVPSNTPEPDQSTLHEPFTSTDHQPPPETTANHPMPPLTRHFSPPPQITTHHTFPPPLSLHYSLPHTSSSQQTNTVTSNAPRSPHRSQSDLFTRGLAGPGSSRSSRENVPSPLVSSWQSRRCNSAVSFLYMYTCNI